MYHLSRKTLAEQHRLKAEEEARNGEKKADDIIEIDAVEANDSKLTSHAYECLCLQKCSSSSGVFEKLVDFVDFFLFRKHKDVEE